MICPDAGGFHIRDREVMSRICSGVDLPKTTELGGGINISTGRTGSAGHLGVDTWESTSAPGV